MDPAMAYTSRLRLQCIKLKIERDPETMDKLIRNQLALISEARRSIPAAVDTMGCHMLHDTNASISDQRFQTLVGGILSPQTRDEITFAAMQRLLKADCTIDNMAVINSDKIAELIKPVGFYKRKAIYINQSAQLLKNQYSYALPNSAKELCKFPGVGPKIANMVVQIAYENTEGIVVDTHVERISKRLGWVDELEKTSSVAEKLQNIFPRHIWPGINRVLVGYGQTICKAIKPECEKCVCNKLCPAAQKPNGSQTTSAIDLEDVCEFSLENGLIIPSYKKPRKRKSSTELDLAVKNETERR